ncbi:MAG: hypothetical protein OXJ90_04090 [Spirochaetaceae bacterium]|nr:hypothetical protein [Spirochaetaceae bacterium]
MASTRVSDLTVAEFEQLVRETVAQALAELLGDPDEGLPLRDDFGKALQRSLDEVGAGEPTRGLADVAQEFTLST